MAKTGTAKTRSGRGFRIGLLIAVLIFFVALLVGLIWFFNYLSDYEESERHHVAERVLEQCGRGDYISVAERTDVVLAGLESKEVYAEEIGKRMNGRKLTYAKAFSYDRFEKPMYKLFADGEYVCQLALKKAGKSKFNFDTYEVDYFTGFDFGIGKAAFLVPDFYTVYCNGIQLGDEYVTAWGLNAELLTYAFTDTDGAALNRYEISGLTTRCNIVAKDPYGGEVVLTENDGKYETSFESMRFCVPDNVSIYVAGVKLGDKYRVEAADGEAGGTGDSTDGTNDGTGDSTNSVTNGTNDGTGDSKSFAPMLYGDANVTGFVTYRVDYITPGTDFIAITADGRETPLKLGADGVYRTGVTEYTVVAPAGLEVRVGDVLISDTDRWVAESGIAVEELSTILDEYLKNRPVLTRYMFSLIDSEPAPQVTVKGVLGDVMELQPDEQLQYTFSFRLDRDVTEFTKLAVNRTKMYAEYITNDMPHDEFMELILQDQPMYAELNDNPYYFYTGHKKHWFENEAWGDLRVYSEDCFSCQVTFDYYIGVIRTDPDFVKMLPLNVRFWFVKYDGFWYMAEWEITS